MIRLRDVCRNIRSKNAGPFWVTIDVFFDGPENFRKHHAAPQLSTDAVARLYGCDATLVKRFVVENLHMVKLSYPRQSPQGGMVERDMHSGQQYVRLLDVELD